MTTKALKAVERMTFWPDQHDLLPPNEGDNEAPPDKENPDES